VKNRLYTIWSGTSWMYFSYYVLCMLVLYVQASMYGCMFVGGWVPTLYNHVNKMEQTMERQQIC